MIVVSMTQSNHICFRGSGGGGVRGGRYVIYLLIFNALNELAHEISVLIEHGQMHFTNFHALQS